jgi:hypothetical protein
MPTAPTPDGDRFREYHVTPRYLAGSSGVGDAGLQPILDLDWHRQDDDFGNLILTSPDQRLKVGWYGDDHDLWKIAAYPDAFSAPAWTATFNQNTPPEIVAGLTTALAHDHQDGNSRFLAPPSYSWTGAAQPLTDAGWTREPAAEIFTVKIIAPDQQAGLRISTRLHEPEDETWTLWAGPPGWGTRAEATFTDRTPNHLIAATAAAMADPTPVIREEHMLHPDLRPFMRLTPVQPPAPPVPPVPTPLDVRRTAVTQALNRADRTPAASDRAVAARARTTRSLSPNDATRSPSPTFSAPPAPAIPRPTRRS